MALKTTTSPRLYITWSVGGSTPSAQASRAIPLGSVITLGILDTTGLSQSTTRWYLLDAPPTSEAVLASATGLTNQITEDTEGSLHLRVVGRTDLPEELRPVGEIHLTVRELETMDGVPAAGEEPNDRFQSVPDAMDGWATELQAVIRRLARAHSQGVPRVGQAGEAGLVPGTVVRISDRVVKGGVLTANQRPWAVFTKGRASVYDELTGPMGVLLGGVDGSAAPPSGTAVKVLEHGPYPTALAGSPAIGDRVYVSDAGTLSLTAGTIERDIGFAFFSSGGTFYAWIDGSVRQVEPRVRTIRPGTNKAAEINAALLALSAAGGGIVQLLGGTYGIETSIEGKSNTRVRGKGPSTVLDPSFTGGADTATNAVIRTTPTVGASTRLTTSAKVGDTSLALLASIGAVAGSYVRIRGVNPDTDKEVYASDGVQVARSQILKVASVSDGGLTLTLVSGVIGYAAAHVDVTVELITPIVNFHVEDLDLDNGGSGASVAGGIRLHGCLHSGTQRISGAGFTRAMITADGGGRGIKIRDTYSRGENNCIVHIDAAHEGELYNTNSDPDGERWHALGVIRGLIWTRSNPTGWHIHGGDLVHGGIGINIWGLRNSTVEDFVIRDMTSAVPADRMMAAGEIVARLVGVGMNCVATNIGQFAENLPGNTFRRIRFLDPMVQHFDGGVGGAPVWYAGNLGSFISQSKILDCEMDNQGTTVWGSGGGVYPGGLALDDSSGIVDGFVFRGVDACIKTRNLGFGGVIRNVQGIGNGGVFLSTVQLFRFEHTADTFCTIENAWKQNLGPPVVSVPAYLDKTLRFRDCALSYFSDGFGPSMFSEGVLAKNVSGGTINPARVVELVTVSGERRVQPATSASTPKVITVDPIDNNTIGVVAILPGQAQVWCSAGTVNFGDNLVWDAANPDSVKVDNAEVDANRILGKAGSTKTGGAGLIAMLPAGSGGGATFTDAPVLTKGASAAFSGEFNIENILATLAFVAGADNVTPLAAKRFSSGQTADIFPILDQAGATLAAFTASGLLNMGSHKITNLTDPTNPQDGATKAYVDSTAAGLDPKASARLKTVASLSAWTPAGSGVGKTLTAPNNNTSNNDFDGVTAGIGDRVLVTQAGGADATPDADNGIYTVTQLANGTSLPTILTRATDADASAEVTNGMFAFVSGGATAAGTGWVLITPDTITLDTTALQFSQFQAAANGAPTDAPYLTNGAVTGLSAERNIQSIGTTLSFIANDVGVTPLAVQRSGSGSTADQQQWRDQTAASLIAISAAGDLVPAAANARKLGTGTGSRFAEIWGTAIKIGTTPTTLSDTGGFCASSGGFIANDPAYGFRASGGFELLQGGGLLLLDAQTASRFEVRSHIATSSASADVTLWAATGTRTNGRLLSVGDGAAFTEKFAVDYLGRALVTRLGSDATPDYAFLDTSAAGMRATASGASLRLIAASAARLILDANGATLIGQLKADEGGGAAAPPYSYAGAITSGFDFDPVNARHEVYISGTKILDINEDVLEFIPDEYAVLIPGLLNVGEDLDAGEVVFILPNNGGSVGSSAASARVPVSHNGTTKYIRLYPD